MILFFICSRNLNTPVMVSSNRVQRGPVPVNVPVFTLKSFCGLWRNRGPDVFKKVRNVIVDEAHNFTIVKEANWYEAVRKLQDSGMQKGYLWVFCDMNQQGYKEETGLPSRKEQDKYKIFTLRDVVRSTKVVFKMVRDSEADHYCKPALCHNYSGSIFYFPYAYGECENMIKHLVNKHISDHERPYADIVVLTSNKAHALTLRDKLSLPREQPLTSEILSSQPPLCVSAEDPKAESGRFLVVDSIFRYGGLGKPVVIVVDYKVPSIHDPKGFKNQVLTRTLDTIYFIQPHQSVCQTQSRNQYQTPLQVNLFNHLQFLFLLVVS